MARTILQPEGGEVWRLAKRQHGVVTRAQLLELGFTREAVQHRVERGRLHRLRQGVYAVGRPEVDQLGSWMAAVLCCGPEALLGHASAAALWGLIEHGPRVTEIVVPARVCRRRPDLRVHRRTMLRPEDRARHLLIPVTSPCATLIDYAAGAGEEGLARAVNAADRLGLIGPDSLRAAIESTPARPGLAPLRALLDQPTFSPTDSWLERRFLSLVREARLPAPRTQAQVNGFRVDFYWPDLGLVVETDGLQYHRTPIQQARDLRREQTHAASGLRTLRFTAAQVRHEPAQVTQTLRATIAHTPSR